MRHALLVFLPFMLVSFTARAAAAPRPGPALDMSHLWFSPMLSVDSDPLCKSLLPKARTWFESSGREEDYPFGKDAILSYGSKGDSNPDPDVTKIEEENEVLVSSGKGQGIYVYFMESNACRGSCKETVVVSKERIEGSQVYADDNEPAKLEYSQMADSWNLIKAVNGQHYVLGILNDQLVVYRIAAPKEFKLSCQIALAPADAEHPQAPGTQDALVSLHALDNAAEAIAGSHGEGFCGTMQTSTRWMEARRAALFKTLYRPWDESLGLDPSQNSYGNYEPIAGQFEEWALGGIYEFDALAALKEQLRKTTLVLSTYYRQQFRWSEQQASAVANRALPEALSHGFGFYMYDGPGDVELRRAILEHKLMSEVIAADSKKDAPPDSDLLTIAVRYPEALAYLLKRGANPDVSNDFGKTPLMYAAQYNQLESVKLLIAAGADVNAATVVPPQDCNHALHTVSVTPLHYAVRYASAALIDALIKGGAVNFIKTIENNGESAQPLGTPLDWLAHFTKSDAQRNANLSAADVAALQTALSHPTPAQLRPLSAKSLAQARSLYGVGKVKEAYRALRLALYTDPENKEALSDLPLIAFKAGQPGPAAEAATMLLAGASPAVGATAWFNLGLVCEKSERGFEYNGQYYCEDDRVTPFLRSYRMEATPARAKKLETLLQADGPGACNNPSNPQGFKYHFFVGRNDSNEQILRGYVLHEKGQTADLAKLFVTAVDFHITERLSLDSHALTIMEATYTGTIPKVGGQECHF